MFHCSANGNSVSLLLAVQRSRQRDEPLDGDVQVGDAVQDKRNQLLVLFLSQELDEGLGPKRLSQLRSVETVLGEAVVKVVRYCIP